MWHINLSIVLSSQKCALVRSHHSVLRKLRNNPTELIAVTTEKMFIILLYPPKDPWEEFVC